MRKSSEVKGLFSDNEGTDTALSSGCWSYRNYIAERFKL